MRNPFYVILLGILIFVSAGSVSAQDTKNDPGSSYNSAIGIRGGFFTGIT